MTFKRSRGGSVYVAVSAMNVLKGNRQFKSSSAEAGGIMLGRLIAGTADIVVDEVVGPLSGDRRRRLAFYRPKKQTQQIVNQAWQASGGTKIYLGEWHTHPEKSPTPSAKDLSNWKRICETAIYEQEYLLFLIVGYKSCRLWELSNGGSLLESIHIAFPRSPATRCPKI